MLNYAVIHTTSSRDCYDYYLDEINNSLQIINKEHKSN